MTAAEILAYWDSTAPLEQDDPEHREQLLADLAAVALRDRDLLEHAIRAACERGRGAELGEVCSRHAAEVAAVQRAQRDDENA